MPKPLRELRNENLYSIRALAAASGVSAGTIFSVETNKSKPSFATMEKVASALHCEISEVQEFKETLEHRGKAYKVAA